MFAMECMFICSWERNYFTNLVKTMNDHSLHRSLLLFFFNNVEKIKISIHISFPLVWRVSKYNADNYIFALVMCCYMSKNKKV